MESVYFEERGSSFHQILREVSDSEKTKDSFNKLCDSKHGLKHGQCINEANAHEGFSQLLSLKVTNNLCQASRKEMHSSLILLPVPKGRAKR